MSHHTAIRTTVATLGASGILAMALAAPAMAYRPDPATGSLQERPGADGSSSSMEYRGGNLGPATTGQGSSNSAVHLKKRSTAPHAPAPVVQVRRVEDNRFEFLQVGAGFLVGATFVGAGALATSRKRHSRVAQPAGG
jgi:hypothetical protein